MVIGIALVILSCLIFFIWASIEFKRMKHKLWALMLIAIVIFGYVSFAITLKGKGIDYSSFSGVTKAGKIYFSWLGSVLGNFKTLTGNAVKMDWKSNKTPGNSTSSE